MYEHIMYLHVYITYVYKHGWKHMNMDEFHSSMIIARHTFVHREVHMDFIHPFWIRSIQSYYIYKNLIYIL
jgi:hypothetical protein